ncbi:hypothetical protein QEJ31_07200 [Pigmentibacter sp. JX0631]|uniref:hypothetical protein n=1 Tax=Pigmentibacter sp. JX0631 TaxID=2976982 RepID=UPI00246999A6|nr:hypothetical protein [Pigmentibacter sp. JX0631]WGL61377.1 hypothetical protein QEJ31_07200 [Pigmentibacter sp. JX0631]
MKYINKFSFFLISIVFISCGKSENNSKKDSIKLNYSHTKFLAKSNYSVNLEGTFTDQCNSNLKNISWNLNGINDQNKNIELNLSKNDDCKLIIHKVNIIDNKNNRVISRLLENVDIEIDDSISNDNSTIKGISNFDLDFNISLNFTNSSCNIKIYEIPLLNNGNIPTDTVNDNGINPNNNGFVPDNVDEHDFFDEV